MKHSSYTITLLFMILNLFSYPYAAYSQESLLENLKNDTGKTIKLMGQGSYLQFFQHSNMVALPLAFATTGYAFHRDEDFIQSFGKDKPSPLLNSMGTLSVVISFPIIPLTTYILGHNQQDQKLKNFSMELTATMYLPMIETSLISAIPVHNRPSTEKENFWEKTFRQNSSFPSGHVIPFAALTFKTAQFYGPTYASLPAALTLLSGWQRVQNQKHYVSDVLGAIFVTWFASEGVRAAAKKQDTSQLTSWISQHQAHLGYTSSHQKQAFTLTFFY